MSPVSRIRDAANEAFLSQSVANPFQGLLPGTTLNGATISRAQLLRPYPQFLAGANNGAVSGTGTISVGTEEYRGSDHYQAGTILIEKRFTGHNSLTASYTRSHETDRINFLNPADDILESRVSPNDRPNRASLGGILDLPFGHGHRYGSGWNALTDAVLGGWTVSATYQWQISGGTINGSSTANAVNFTPSIVLSPDTGNRNTGFNVQATGFAPNEYVSVYGDGTYLGSLYSYSGGTGSGGFTIPCRYSSAVALSRNTAIVSCTGRPPDSGISLSHSRMTVKPSSELSFSMAPLPVMRRSSGPT